MDAKFVKITLQKSLIGRPKAHRRTVKALGLRCMHTSVVKPNTPSILGMVNKVGYLLRVEGARAEENAYYEDK
ncbi:MAG TPA: 50S ribosomal protein L30 [Atribacteraceae bacterium]|nr:50S ribosomal protein L30 [Atribacteraceae bacterium]